MSATKLTKEQMLRGPALHPPSGQPAHVIAPQDYAPRQHTFYICVAFCTIISGSFLALRIYNNFLVFRKRKLDDYLLLLAFVLLLCNFGIGRVTLDHGVAIHQWNISLAEFFKLLYWLNLTQIVYPPCSVCIKTALVLQYLRIFAPVRTVNNFMFIGSWAIIALNFGFYSARMLVSIFECIPREKIWNKMYVGGTCIDNSKIHAITGFFNIFTDVVVLLFPVGSVWRLRIPRWKKFGISLLFTSGLLATIATSLRTLYGVRATRSGDWSYNMAWDGLWSYAELTLGIIVACGIELPKLVKEKRLPFQHQFAILTSVFKRSSTSDNTGGSTEFEGFKKIESSATDPGSHRNGDASANGMEAIKMDNLWDATIKSLA